MNAPWDEFVQACADLLRADGEHRPIHFDAAKDRLAVGEPNGPMSFVHLVHARREWQRAPAVTRPRVLRRRFWSSIQHAPGKASPPLPLHAVYPQIRDTAWFSAMRRQAELTVGDDERSIEQLTLPHEKINSDLAAHLMLELPSSVSELGADRIRSWAVPFADLYRRAQDNLRAVSQGTWHEREAGVFQSPFEDGLDATRIVLTELFQALPVKGAPIVVAPTHEQVFVTGEDDASGLVKLAQLAEDALGDTRSHSAFAFRLENDKWVRWLPAKTHPAYAKLFLLGLQTTAAAYARQKQVLEALLDATGHDIVVADLRAFRSPSGDIVTATAWQEGLETLLPQTDRIDFVSFGKDPSATAAKVWSTTFDIARKTLGELMHPIGDLPERWLVKGFPDESQLEQMALEGKL